MIEKLEKNENISSVLAVESILGPGVPTSMFPSSVTSNFYSDNYTYIILNCKVDYEGDTTFNLIKTIRKTANTYFPNAYYLAGKGVSTYDLMDTITQDMVRVNFIAIAGVFIVLLITLKFITLPILLVLTIETSV